MTTLLLEHPVTKELSLRSFLYSAPKKHKTFRYSIDICLKDSNAYGNTYFARYFEWQGVCPRALVL